jgi:hypothetical protein
MIDETEMRRWFKEGKDFSSDWRDETRSNYDIIAGRQWSSEEIEYLQERLRPALVFNRVAPVVNAIRGHFIVNQPETKFLPREIGDQGVVDVANAGISWVDELCNADHHIADMLVDAAASGMGWIEIRMDFHSDPDGKLISAERISPLEMIWDPASTSVNLMDSRYRMRGRWMDIEEAESLFGKKVRDISLGYGESGVNDLEIPLQVETSPERYREDLNSNQWIRPHLNEIYVIQGQYWENDTSYQFADPQSGKKTEVDSKTASRLEKMGFPTQKIPKRKYYQFFSAGGEFLIHEPAPYQDGFTLLCCTVNRDVLKNTWYGIVRAMVDPQKWSNKFLTDIQDFVASNRRGGAFVEEDAFVDPRRAEELWNDPSGLILLQSGSLASGKIQERNPIAYPMGLDRLLQFAINAIPDVTGVNLELMGMVDRNQPGILEAQRKQAGLTILAPLFDSIKLLLKERGRVALWFMKNFVADGRLLRITGPDGQQFIPFLLQGDVTKFDISVDTAPTSPDMKSQTFRVLSDLVPYMAKLGIPPPGEIFQYLPIPATLAQKWQESVNQQKEQPQQDPKAAIEGQKMQMEGQKMQMEDQKNQMDLQVKTKELELEERKLELEQKKVEVELAKMQSELMSRQSEIQGPTEHQEAVASIKETMVEVMSAAQAMQQAVQILVSGLAGLQEGQSRMESEMMRQKVKQISVRREKGRIVGAQVVEQ